MRAIPIQETSRANPPAEWLRTVDALAVQLLAEHPELTLPEPFRGLMPCQLEPAPSLLLDDLSEIPRLDRGRDVRFYQDRARLRAGDGDLVASCGDPIPEYETYCQQYLGLGAPQWLRPPPPHLPLRIAEACWEDGVTRERLIQKLKRGELRYLHPHMGTLSSWELAFLLSQATGCPLQVIASPPGLTRWVNDKIAFAKTVTRLFGPRFVPRTESASNFAYVAKRVLELTQQCDAIGFKLPNCVGGDGNVVVPASELRTASLREIPEKLKPHFRKLAWDGATPILIDCWESPVIGSPSAQIWIPADADQRPIVEGVFTQCIEGVEGMFVGSMPSRLEPELHQEIVDRCWTLARLYQRLGYVGRCSFDMILVGDSSPSARLEFVECNGRWGGTSLPMTLMNRLFGDWRRRPYAVQVVHHITGLERLGFAQVMAHFAGEVFDIRRGTGSLIFINPGRLKYQAGITVLALGESYEQACEIAGAMPTRLGALANAINSPR